MSKLTKIILVVLLITIGSFVLKVMWQNGGDDSLHHAEFPVGSPNVPHASGGVVPTTVGYTYDQVRPFDTLLPEPPQPAFRSVLESVYLDDYGIFPCHADDEETNVVMFTAKSLPDGDGFSYESATETVTSWEPHALKDIGSFIFPNKTLPQSPGLVSFTDIESVGYKRGVVNFTQGSGYIYTGWRLNYVFYASSLECLEGAMDLVYHYD